VKKSETKERLDKYKIIGFLTVRRKLLRIFSPKIASQCNCKHIIITFLLIVPLILIFSAFAETVTANAFSLPDVKKGFTLSVEPHTTISPTIAIELYELDLRHVNIRLFGVSLIKDLGRWNFDAGIGTNLVFISVSKILVPVVEIQLGAFWGYNFGCCQENRGFATGFILSGILW